MNEDFIIYVIVGLLIYSYSYFIYSFFSSASSSNEDDDFIFKMIILWWITD